MKKEQWIRAGFLLLSCVVLVICCVSTLNRKEAFFLDEYASYSCANSDHGKTMQFKNGVTYTRDEVRQLALDTFAVSEERRFSFGNVWRNLSKNVHPPVFYAALHLACSLTPGVFSIWQCAIVNILFGVLSLFWFYRFTRAFVKQEWAAGFLCLCWAGTQGLCGTVILLRDYTSSMLGALIVGWEAFRYLRGNRKVRDLVRLALASAFSVLCHYYCAIYLFFLCAVLCVTLMIRKQWKDFGKILAAEACAAGVAIAVFPSMVTRILFSKRGTDATASLVKGSISAYLAKISNMYRVINKSFFGTLLPYALILGFAALLAWLLLRKKGCADTAEAGNEPGTAELCLIAVPAVCFVVLVSKIMPYNNVRYMYPVTAFLYLSVIAFLSVFGRRLPARRAMAAVLCVVMAVMSGTSWVTGEFRYLYEGKKASLEENLAPYTGADAVMIWDSGKFRNCLTLQHAEYFGTMTYYYKAKDKELASIPVLEEGRDVIVIIAKDTIEKLEKLKEYYPEYTVTPAIAGEDAYDDTARAYYRFHKE